MGTKRRKGLIRERKRTHERCTKEGDFLGERLVVIALKNTDSNITSNNKQQVN